MSILFICYWGINEGLTQATVLPHIEILSQRKDVRQVVLVTIERKNFYKIDLPTKITHIPIISKNLWNVFLNKYFDFINIPKQLIKLCKEQGINLIICRSSLAGALGYLIWTRLKIQYVVESFEPHARYMTESGVWSKLDLRYWVQRYFEFKQEQTARYLLPVSENFRKKLISKNLNESRLITMPCCLNVESFAFSKSHRLHKRRELRIDENAIVGIYVGKFGGIYYEVEAFNVFYQSFEYFGEKFHLILLTELDNGKLLKDLTKYKIDVRRVHVLSVLRNEVPAYLSASDFSYTFYRRSHSKRYLSPIKIGEYWANGLPVLIEEGIGDDAEIIANEGGGLICDYRAGLIDFGEILKGERDAARNKEVYLALKYRDLGIVRSTYNKILTELITTS